MYLEYKRGLWCGVIWIAGLRYLEWSPRKGFCKVGAKRGDGAKREFGFLAHSPVLELPVLRWRECGVQCAVLHVGFGSQVLLLAWVEVESRQVVHTRYLYQCTNSINRYLHVPCSLYRDMIQASAVLAELSTA